MSEMELPHDIVEVRELWSVGVRVGDDTRWVEYGRPSADAASILRTHDYFQENKPETESCILKTVVVIGVENEKLLREKVKQDSATEKGADVQSE